LINYKYLVYKNPRGESPSNLFDDMLAPAKKPAAKREQVKLLKLRIWTKSKPVDSSEFKDKSFTGPSRKTAEYWKDVTALQNRVNKILNTYGVKVLLNLTQGKITYRVLFDGPKAWKNVSVWRKITKELKKIV